MIKAVQKSMMCLVFATIVFEGKATGTRCESKGLGEPAQITCDVGQTSVKGSDVSAVLLQHFPLQDTNRIEETVVECRRYFYKEFDCLFEVDYKINGTISNQLIITIAKVRPEHQGKYHCLIVTDYIAIQRDSCVMEFKESDNATTSAPPFRQETDNRKEDAGTSVPIAAVIPLSVFLFVVLMGIILFVFGGWRRRRQRNRRQEEKGVEMHDRTIKSLLQPDYGHGPDRKDARQTSYKRTKVKDSSGGVSISATRDASPVRSLKEFSISAWSNIGDNNDVNTNSPSTNAVHSVADKKPCIDDNNYSQCGDHIIRGVTDPSSKTSSGLEMPQSDYVKSCIDTRTVCLKDIPWLTSV